MSQLSPEPIEDRAGSHVPQLLFGQRDAAKVSMCRELCIAQRKLPFPMFVSRQFEVGFDLTIEIVILGSAPTPEAEVSHESPCLLSRFHHEPDGPSQLSPFPVLARHHNSIVRTGPARRRRVSSARCSSAGSSPRRTLAAAVNRAVRQSAMLR